METRRQFIKKAAILSGAAGLSGTLTASIERALAIEPDQNTTFLDAEHVVILMQENRSFDHAYGTLRGVRGFNDPRAVALPNGNPAWVQTNSAGVSYVPFRLDIKNSNSTWTGCLPHGWTDQVDARNNGRYDRWLDAKRSGEQAYADMPLTLGYYTRADIPFYYELADAFTICDHNFCSSLTGTTPNRLYLWTGTIRAEQHGNSPACVLNSDAVYDNEVSWATFPERLEDLGVAWKIYQNEVWVGAGLSKETEPWLTNFGDNPIEYFTQFNVRYVASHRRYLQSQVQAKRTELDNLQRRLEDQGVTERDAQRLRRRVRRAERELQQAEELASRWSEQNFDRLSPREKALHAQAFATNSGDPDYHQVVELSYRDGDEQRSVIAPKGDLFHQLRRDVAEGALPTVSWVVAPERFSDHPCSAWYGAWYIAELIDILTQNPEVWKKTVFILTYDENDGYFDHLPPFVCPDPRRPETGRVSEDVDASLEFVELEQELKRKPRSEARESSIGLGYRVPMIIASPWTRGGWVCSQVCDHTSPLQFLEKFLTHKLGREVKEPNISQWRRTVCGDLTPAFRPATVASASRLDFPARDEFIKEIHRAKLEPPPSGFRPLTDAELTSLKTDPRSSALLPRQEPGTRPSCPLPYELVAESRLSDDGGQLLIRLEARNELFGDTASGAPFTAYARGVNGDLQVRNYAVSAGRALEDAWRVADFTEGKYDVSIHGPNGFYRRFQGSADQPRLSIRVLPLPATKDRFPAAVAVFEIASRDQGVHTVEVIDRTYGQPRQSVLVEPGETKTLAVSLASSHGWYDLQVQTPTAASFSAIFAGRLETGAASLSDPAMANS
jgi:phospholipase C